MVSPFEQLTATLDDREDIHYYGRTFALCLIFFVPTFFFGMVGMYIMPVHMALSTPVFEGRMLSVNNVLLLVLATPVQLWLGWRFHLGCWQAAKHKSMTMDTLVSVSTTAAYVYSVVAVMFMALSSTFESEVMLLM